jgi:hypothetical protein
VSEVFDIQTVSIAIASAGVFLAAIYYIWQIRHQTKLRQTDLVWRMIQTMYADDYREAILKVLNLDFKDYEDFVKKYGPYLSDSPTMKALTKINVLYSNLGDAVRKNLIDFELVNGVFNTACCRAWEKVKPIIEGYRKASNQPTYLRDFEYLYNEMMKREQKLQSKA